MGKADGVAAIIFGIFIIVVSRRMRWQSVFDLLKQDVEFLAWLASVSILLFLRKQKELAGPVNGLITAAFVGMVLLNFNTFQREVKNTWDTLRGKKR